MQQAKPKATAWSYSRWETYKNCPRKFYYGAILRLPQEPSAPMLRGKILHEQLANYISGKTTALPALDTGASLVNEMRAQPNKIVEEQWGFNRHWQPCGWFGKDTWMRAILDVLVLYEDSSAEAIDHKFGKRYGKHDDQMELFAVATMLKIPSVREVGTRLVYYTTGEEDYGHYTRMELPKLIKKWEANVAPMMADTEFAATPNEMCRFCPFSKSAGGPCEFG